MDDLTRYIMRKANVAAQDEFHQMIEPRDVEILKSAMFKAAGIPLFGIGFYYAYMMASSAGGFAGNFVHHIVRAN